MSKLLPFPARGSIPQPTFYRWAKFKNPLAMQVLQLGKLYNQFLVVFGVVTVPTVESWSWYLRWILLSEAYSVHDGQYTVLLESFTYLKHAVLYSKSLSTTNLFCGGTAGEFSTSLCVWLLVFCLVFFFVFYRPSAGQAYHRGIQQKD